LNKYANPGYKILDTHVGSASSLVACEELGFKYVGFEIDPEYYEKGMERLENNRAQMSLFRNDLQEEVQGWEK
jgi:site-specific DNA-methyltransferase (adenine-specific)